MNIARALIFVSFLLLLNTPLFSQNDSALFSKETVFKNGIYITYEEFKNNNPGLTPENFSTYNPGISFLGYELNKSRHVTKYHFPIANDSIGTIYPDSVFAFVAYNTPHFLYPPASPLMRAFNLGGSSKKESSLNFFAGLILEPGYLSILYFEERNLLCDNDTVDPVKFISSTRAGNETWTSQAPNTNQHYVYTKVALPKKQLYLLNLKTGTIFKLNKKNLAMVFEKRDSELFEEYKHLSSKKQEQMKFIYVKKFNERNPVYIPVRN